jgi:hypothetical protein
VGRPLLSLGFVLLCGKGIMKGCILSLTQASNLRRVDLV